MSDEDALLKAICADPDDHTARLVFADFLQECGGKVEVAWATFIRAHVRLDTNTELAGDIPCVRLLGSDYWLKRFAVRLGIGPESGVTVGGWECGFPAHLAADYPLLRCEWDTLLDRVPKPDLRVGGIEDEAVEDVVSWPRLDKLMTLDLTTWDGTMVPRTLSERGVAALVNCPAVTGLESLGLSFLDVTERVAELILGSPHLARLRVLALRTSTSHALTDPQGRKRLCDRFGPNAVA
jgi:uncharacterized protein (TIGR02996 family)